MITTADWFHIQWLLLYFVATAQQQHGGDKTSIALETACASLWEGLEKIGRSVCTYKLISDKLLKHGIVVQFLKRHLDVVNPCVRVMIEETYKKMIVSFSTIKMWDCLTSKNHNVGKEYLVHHSSYETLLPYFCSAFYRPSWERPIVFWFLNPAFDRVRHQHIMYPDARAKDCDDGGVEETASKSVVKRSVCRKVKNGLSRPRASKREARMMRKEKRIKEKRAGKATKQKLKIVNQHTTRYSKIDDQYGDQDYDDYYPYPDDYEYDYYSDYDDDYFYHTYTYGLLYYYHDDQYDIY